MKEQRWKDRARGSVSLFLVLILMPLFSGTYLAIEAGRVSAARSRMESALDLTGNAALNDYDQALKDWYGMFAMARSAETLETRMASVFSGTMDVGETAGENYIDTRTTAFELTFPSEASLARPDVLERTVTDYMKYRGPYGFARGVSQRLGAFQNIKSVSETLSKSQDYYESLSGVSKQLTKLADALPTSPSEGFDVDREEQSVKSILDGLDRLSSKVRKTDASAKAWKESLEGMPEGEAKALLAGDYKATAEVLSSSGIETLRGKLQSDLDAIRQYRSAKADAEAARAEAEDPASVQDPEAPSLAYYEDSLYG
ncbi:MAG: Tad domain-containing protein, partial [Clostridia bacterium]|nr:Tad domain-containing protein [Clostridia bacterium]